MNLPQEIWAIRVFGITSFLDAANNKNVSKDYVNRLGLLPLSREQKEVLKKEGQVRIK